MPPDGAVTWYAAHAIQLALGAIFLSAAAPKLRRPARFVRTVAGYRLLPKSVTPLAAHGLLVVESVLALTLLTGWFTVVTVPLASATLVVFFAAAAYTLGQGRRIPCGCFGDSAEMLSARTLVRLAMMLSAALFLLANQFTANVRPLTAGDIVSSAYGVQTSTLAMFLLVLGTWLLHLPELAFVGRGRISRSTTHGWTPGTEVK